MSIEDEKLTRDEETSEEIEQSKTSTQKEFNPQDVNPNQSKEYHDYSTEWDLKQKLGMNPDALVQMKDLSQLGYLDDYTDVKNSPLSKERDNYRYSKNLSLETIKEQLKQNAQDTNIIIHTFGAPFSYLEPVDPYGRVYKDTFGLRREEIWFNENSTVKYPNTDSKTFLATIKVGMLAKATGTSLAAQSADAGVNKLKSDVDNTKDESLKNQYSKALDDSKNSIVTSYYLSYFFTAKDMFSGGKAYVDGNTCPFNKFILNAAMRVLDDFNNHPNVRQLERNIENMFGFNSFPFFRFVCCEESVNNESVQNQFGDSFLKSVIEGVQNHVFREFSFVTNGALNVDGLKQMASKIKSDTISETINKGINVLSNFVGKDYLNSILQGNALIYPRIWQGSYVEKMLSLQMRFYSPYGNYYSIFMNVTLPLLVLMGIALPRQVDPSFISFPFVFSVEIPGLFQSNMAACTNFVIRRGGRYDAWTDYAVARGIDVTLDVMSLRPVYGFPEEGYATFEPDGTNKIDNSIFGTYKGEGTGSEGTGRRGDQTFANTMRNLCGMFIFSDQRANLASAALAKNLTEKENYLKSENVKNNKAVDGAINLNAALADQDQKLYGPNSVSGQRLQAMSDQIKDKYPSANNNNSHSIS